MVGGDLNFAGYVGEGGTVDKYYTPHFVIF